MRSWQSEEMKEMEYQVDQDLVLQKNMFLGITNKVTAGLSLSIWSLTSVNGWNNTQVENNQ